MILGQFSSDQSYSPVLHPVNPQGQGNLALTPWEEPIGIWNRLIAVTLRSTHGPSCFGRRREY